MTGPARMTAPACIWQGLYSTWSEARDASGDQNGGGSGTVRRTAASTDVTDLVGGQLSSLRLFPDLQPANAERVVKVLADPHNQRTRN